MARIYANTADELIRALFTEDEERQYPAMPDGAAFSLDFDGDSNPQVVAALCGGVLWQDIRLVDNVLFSHDQPVIINPPGEYYQDRQYLLDWWTKLNTAIDNTDAALLQTEQAESLWPTLSPQEKQAWLVAHFDEVLGGLALVLRILHGVLRFIRWLIKREAVV